MQIFVFMALFGHNITPLTIETLKIIFPTELQKVPPDSLSSYHFVLSSDDDNEQYEDLQKDKYKDKDTETQKQCWKCFHDPMYAIFLKSRAWVQGYQICNFFQKFPPSFSEKEKKSFSPKFLKLVHQKMFY